ncbi:hypothetical protein [Streptomyces monashensis]|uniref:Uncharacterized protein n=1 Tax=Streptomyces monashensis TaxID=1678012 RepID=A0A1S2NYV7_9ACTN|nr:hypothetical protein BIV23_43680 [Streptomyces monashensis]
MAWLSAAAVTHTGREPGWFYHHDQQPKSVGELTGICFRSVGRNSVLLLDVPPDTDGLLPAPDVARLRQFRDPSTGNSPRT